MILSPTRSHSLRQSMRTRTHTRMSSGPAWPFWPCLAWGPGSTCLAPSPLPVRVARVVIRISRLLRRASAVCGLRSRKTGSLVKLERFHVPSSSMPLIRYITWMMAWSLSIPRHLKQEEPETRWQNSETLASEATGEPELRTPPSRGGFLQVESPR